RGDRTRWPVGALRELGAPPLPTRSAPVEYPLRREPLGHIERAHVRRISRRPRRISRSGELQWPLDPRALYHWGDGAELRALGAGVLRRWRYDVGDELDHRVHAHRGRAGGYDPGRAVIDGRREPRLRFPTRRVEDANPPSRAASDRLDDLAP